MVTRSLPEQIMAWGIMSDNLQPYVGELQHLAPLRAELNDVIAEAKRLEAEQETLKAALARTNEQRAQVLARGQELMSRLSRLLRASLGGKNVELLQFGVRPWRGGRPRKRRQPPERAEEPSTPVE
jgi:hypothetical protein